jgi:hypothetical protein
MFKWLLHADAVLTSGSISAMFYFCFVVVGPRWEVFSCVCSWLLLCKWKDSSVKSFSCLEGRCLDACAVFEEKQEGCVWGERVTINGCCLICFFCCRSAVAFWIGYLVSECKLLNCRYCRRHIICACAYPPVQLARELSSPVRRHMASDIR